MHKECAHNAFVGTSLTYVSISLCALTLDKAFAYTSHKHLKEWQLQARIYKDVITKLGETP